jgi:hypothetical protein
MLNDSSRFKKSPETSIADSVRNHSCSAPILARDLTAASSGRLACFK